MSDTAKKPKVFGGTVIRHLEASVYIREDGGGRNVVVLILDKDGHHEYVVAPHPTSLGRVALYEMSHSSTEAVP